MTHFTLIKFIKIAFNEIQGGQLLALNVVPTYLQLSLLSMPNIIRRVARVPAELYGKLYIYVFFPETL